MGRIIYLLTWNDNILARNLVTIYVSFDVQANNDGNDMMLGSGWGNHEFIEMLAISPVVFYQLWWIYKSK